MRSHVLPAWLQDRIASPKWQNIELMMSVLFEQMQHAVDQRSILVDAYGQYFKQLMTTIAVRAVYCMHTTSMGFISVLCTGMFINDIVGAISKSFTRCLHTYSRIHSQSAGRQQQLLCNHSVSFGACVSCHLHVVSGSSTFETVLIALVSDFRSRCDYLFVQCLFVSGVLVLYFLMFAPFIRQVDRTIKRTREMLLLFPADVIVNVPAIADLVREYAYGKRASRS